VTGIRLNIGCATCIFAGWTNLDHVDMSSYVQFLRTTGMGGLPKEQAELARRVQAAEAAGEKTDFRVHDLRKGLPFGDNSVDFIYFGQVIEHLNPLYEVPPFLAECRRVLQPGGLVRISTPDLDILLASYQSGDMMEFAIEQPQPYRDAKSKALRLAYLMFGSLGPASTNEHYEGHHLTYNKDAMREVLENAGFVDVQFFTPGMSQSAVFSEEAQDTGITHSLFAEATKPA
jgi:predicted SAM-dependent methyltransferase